MESFKKFMANVAIKTGDIAMNTTCLGAYYEPEVPQELIR